MNREPDTEYLKLKTVNWKLLTANCKLLTVPCLLLATGCGVYSFTGASIAPGAKTVNVHFIENKAPANTNPTLTQKLTEALRNKITSQTSLAQVNSDDADYILGGAVTGYAVSNAAVTNVEQSTTLRLTVTVEIDFKSKLNPKAGFKQSFARSADFEATQSLPEVQDRLAEQINKQLVDDIFNKCFVNW